MSSKLWAGCTPGCELRRDEESLTRLAYHLNQECAAVGRRGRLVAVSQFRCGEGVRPCGTSGRRVGPPSPRVLGHSLLIFCETLTSTEPLRSGCRSLPTRRDSRLLDPLLQLRPLR